MADDIAVTDPRTGAVISHVPAGTPEAASDAVDRAAAALPHWSALEPEERSRLLHAVADALQADLDELVRVEASETGQAIDFVTGAVSAAIDNWRHFADTASPDYLVDPLPEGGAIHRRPLGVSALIVPWNFPLLIAFRFLPGMLAVGNTVVWKPSERTPLSAVRAMECISRVLPDGVVTLLLGDGRAGGPLVEDPRVRLVALTGSTATGRYVAEVSGRLLRPVLLELGGKDAVIIDDGVDIAWAAQLVADGCFTNTGQICTSMERIYVHRAIADEFTEALVARTRSAWQPAPLGGTLGPLIDDAQKATVHRHVADAVAKGARVEIGGDDSGLPGSYYPATVLTGVTHEMLVMTAETFGPIAPIMVVNSMTEALDLAANSEYGLSASVLSPNPETLEAAQRLDVGTVWINTWHSYADGAIHQPGGSSGTGAIGWRGRQFLDAVSAPQFVSTPS